MGQRGSTPERSETGSFGDPGEGPRGAAADTKPEPLASRVRRTLRIPFRSTHLPVSAQVTTWSRFAASLWQHRDSPIHMAPPLAKTGQSEERRVPTVPDSPEARRASGGMSRSSIDPVALSVERHEGALRKAAITSGIIGGIVSLVVLIFIGQRLRQENAEQPAQKPPSQIVEAPARATLSPQALEAFPTGATEPAPKTTAQPDQPAASTAAPTSVPPQRSERRLGTRTASRKDQPGASDARTRDLPLLE